MSQTTDYKRGYGAGYQAAASRRWHAHRPPDPPSEIIREIVAAAQALRDGFDVLLATTGPDEELEDEFGPLVARLDASLGRVTSWLRER